MAHWVALAGPETRDPSASAFRMWRLKVWRISYPLQSLFTDIQQAEWVLATADWLNQGTRSLLIGSWQELREGGHSAAHRKCLDNFDISGNMGAYEPSLLACAGIGRQTDLHATSTVLPNLCVPLFPVPISSPVLSSCS